MFWIRLEIYTLNATDKRLYETFEINFLVN